MEGKNQVGKSSSSSASSSSATPDMLGSRETNSPASSEIFDSLFAPRSKVLGMESLLIELKRQEHDNAALNLTPGTQDIHTSGGGNQSAPNTEMSSIYHEQRIKPCNLSSSIMYGGQDIYDHRPSTHRTPPNWTYKKDSTEDDSGSASRGDWWQGSLYY